MANMSNHKKRRDHAFMALLEDTNFNTELLDLIRAYSYTVSDRRPNDTQAFVAEKISYLLMMKQDIKLIRGDLLDAISGDDIIWLKNTINGLESLTYFEARHINKQSKEDKE